MQLLHRQTQPQDLPAAVELVQDGFCGAERALLPELAEMLAGLITAGCANSVVIEDRSHSPGRLVGFGFSTYVTDAFVAEARQLAEPYLTRQLLLRWQAGRFPGLSQAGIRQANREGGLNVVGLHTIWGRPGMSDAQCLPIRDRMLQSLFSTHRGYNIKTFMKEVYGEEERERHLVFGFLPFNDYASFSGSDRRPYLVGISREEALDPAREGRFIRELFRHSPPICAFTTSDQELLQLALTGLAESELARILEISRESVKSRWDSVYAHLPRGLENALFSGSEERLKSRLLLNWLRNHPEELRPSSFFSGVDLVGDFSLPERAGVS